MAGVIAAPAQPPKEKKFTRRADGAIIRKADGAVVRLPNGAMVKDPVPDPNWAPPRDPAKVSSLARPVRPSVPVKQEIKQEKRSNLFESDSDDGPVRKQKKMTRVADDSDSDVPIRRSLKKPSARRQDSDSDVPLRRIKRQVKDESSDSDAPIRVRKPRQSQPRKAPQYDSDAESDDGEMQTKMRDRSLARSQKENVVANLLSRWWYAMPDWPPANYDYRPELAKKKLRLCNVASFDDEPEERNGLAKCYMLNTFTGMFRDCYDKLHDMRPKDTCPSYTNFMKKSETELWRLLQTALTNQFAELEKSMFKKCIAPDTLKDMYKLKERADIQCKKR